jgi:tRNA-2-methylthio-N6-dimethylallyladenosine synthase
VNAYRDPSREALSFAGLLRRLARIDDGLKRIRFTSPHPNDFTDDLIDAIASYPEICNHAHIPAQSGSTKVLRAMRRGYTRESYVKTVARIRCQSRPIAISTDIIVGFPGETDEDFLDTLHLLDEVQYDSVFSFLYSPRPQTRALEMEDDVPVEEKKARLGILQEHQKRIQLNINAAYVGQAVDVLVDGRARNKFTLSGRMSNNKIVNFDGPDDLMGQIVRVEISSFSANSLKGAGIP